MKRAINEGTSEAGVEKLPAQSINAKISFDDKEDSFINIKWTILNDLLNASSDQWEFIAFGSDHKTAIISIFNNQIFDKIKNDILQIEVNDNIHKILLEELKPSLKRGIIHNKFLIPLSDDEIKQDLLLHGIEEIFRLQKTDPINEQKVYTGSIILSFSANFSASFVIIGNIKIPVNTLAPKPMLCTHCGLLGHTNKRCKKITIELCMICFFDHDPHQPCKLHCKNCNEEHYSNYKGCYSLKKEIQILKVKESHNINYFDAKKIVESASKEIDEAVNDKVKDRETERIKLLIEEKNKLLEELKNQREICQKQSNEIKHLKKEVPSIKQKFVDYRTDNDAKVTELHNLLEKETARSSEEISLLTKENIEMQKKNQALDEKNKNLELKCNNLEKKEKESHSLFQEFCKKSDISEKFSSFCSKKKLDNPFLNRSISKDRNPK